MKLFLILAAAIALGLTSVIAGGPKSASITIAEQDATSVTFTVTQANYRNPYLLWVANKCYLNGELVNAEYQGVQWAAGEATGTAGPFATSGDSCTAYVWEFPASETPERVRGADVALDFVVN